jgi:tetratricopeptide (TPR) repeat protein
MALKKTDLLLYFIYLDEKGLNKNGKYTKEQIASGLDIKESSINIYLSKLSSQDYIHRKRRRHVKYILDTIELTSKGEKLVEDEILEKLENVHFTPERHSIDACITYKELSNLITNPLDKVFLLTMYRKMFKFDLYSYVSNIKSIKDDSKIQKIFQESEHEKNENFLSAFYNISLYSEEVYNRIKNPKELSEMNIDTLIIQAENYLKRGDIENSESLYKSLLVNKNKITQNQWFLINIGLVNVYRKREDYQRAMTLLEDLEQQTEDKRFLVYIKQVKALEIGLRGQFEESIDLFTSAIRQSFHFNNPLLTDICYANRGLIYFINKEYNKAESDWIKAKKFAQEASSRYSEGKNLTNLADIEILKGNFETAEKYLEEAESIFFDLKDLEGISMIAYNKGLYYLALKDLEKALIEYTKFITVAQPCSFPLLMKSVLRRFNI